LNDESRDPTRGGLSADQAVELASSIANEMGKVVVGQQKMIRHIVTSFFAAGHVLLEGVPGLGKTLTVLALARTFGGKFARVQFTPDLMPSDVVGHAMYEAKSGEFRIRRGPAFTNLLLADEINRAPAKTQSALLEVMQEQQISIEGTSYPLSPPFMALATQNPIELEGTYPLPEAQLDRFLMKVVIDYPTDADEVQLVEAVTLGHVGDTLDVSAVEGVADAETVLAVQEFVASLVVDPAVIDYAVRIARSTREWPGVAIGAGPRGAIALIRIARAEALLSGRGYVTPDDIKRVALPALRHRITLAPDMEIEGRQADEVLEAILGDVEAPRG
jgi:MoxR-like ATPase